MTAVCIGKFDALHLGHQALVRKAVMHGKPVMLSFTGMAHTLGWDTRLPVVCQEDRPRVLSTWDREMECHIQWEVQPPHMMCTFEGQPLWVLYPPIL